ncbi:BNR-4 repeat-containing protein [Paenibacillus methanolicus]|uniref:Putative BNR repeat neuraminidase n=1 Tax=Paenibacillus methanolicus TaxID=582686 RepID=A0A5S5C686_9BACL|nr:BNR-4 repeat-containing protein [Paenibacillus methanolicus]TYP74827.1 putative BNR repeat neuraminidase [Paenibacillus methanolicus]
MRRLSVHGFRLLLVAFMLVGYAGPYAPKASAAGESIAAIESNASYHSRRTFGIGLYDGVANKTFIAYSGPEMDVYVKAYNHASQSWEAAVKVYDWNDSSQFAYHDYPTMVLLPDGKLGIFALDHAVSAYLIKAPTAHSLSGTWTRTQISTDKNTYPMPIVSGQSVYLFYSRNDDLTHPYRTYRYTKSTDNGATWSAPVTAIDSGKTADKFSEVYAYGVAEKDGKIYVTWSMAGGAGGHNQASRHLYLAYLDTATGQMHNAGGQSMGSVVNEPDLAACLVVSAEPDTASANYGARHPISNSAPSVTKDGKVVVAYGQQNADGTSAIRLAAFASGAWTVRTADAAAGGFTDVVKAGAGTNEFEVLYASADGDSLVSKKTTDLGASWTSLYTLAVPFGPGNADSIVYANYIEQRQGIRVVGATINVAERQTDYTGKWNVFAIKQ